MKSFPATACRTTSLTRMPFAGAADSSRLAITTDAPENGILVADGVKQLLAGKDFAFVDQGEVALKGFDEPVRAWAVEWA